MHPSQNEAITPIVWTPLLFYMPHFCRLSSPFKGIPSPALVYPTYTDADLMSLGRLFGRLAKEHLEITRGQRKKLNWGLRIGLPRVTSHNRRMVSSRLKVVATPFAAALITCTSPDNRPCIGSVPARPWTIHFFAPNIFVCLVMGMRIIWSPTRGRSSLTLGSLCFRGNYFLGRHGHGYLTPIGGGAFLGSRVFGWARIGRFAIRIIYAVLLSGHFGRTGIGGVIPREVGMLFCCRRSRLAHAHRSIPREIGFFVHGGGCDRVQIISIRVRWIISLSLIRLSSPAD